MSKLQVLLETADSLKEKGLSQALFELNITEERIKSMHQEFCSMVNIITDNKYRTISQAIAETDYIPPSPEELPHLMAHYGDQIRSSLTTLHPIELAAMAYKRFLDIQPFLEGNETVALDITNLILESSGYPAITDLSDCKTEMDSALSASRKQYDMIPISKLIAKCVIQAEG